MLKQRIISGVIMAVVAIVLVTLMPNWVVALVSAVILMIAAWEWSRLTSQTDVLLKGLFLTVVAVCLVLTYVLRETWLTSVILTLAFFAWIMVLVGLWSYRQVDDTPPREQTLLAAAAPLLLSAAFAAAVGLHQLSPVWLLYALIITAIADVGAYFVGKQFGEKKLSPHLSPGKTREGLFGGVVAVFIIALFASLLLPVPGSSALSFILLSVLMSLVSVLGDLFFSMLKRESGHKDSGNILPGHGGVLDRLDSHIAVLPVFYAGLHWILVA